MPGQLVHGREFIFPTLHNDGDTQFRRAPFHHGGLTAGYDRHLYTHPLQQFDPETVLDVEGFGLTSLAVVGHLAIGQHAIHIQSCKPDGSRHVSKGCH